MENLNAEQSIKELENQTKFAKLTNSTGVLLSAKCAQFCLDHVQYYEQKIKELTEKYEKLSKAFVDLLKEAETYLKQRDALQNRVKYLEKNNNERQTDA